MTMLQNLFRPRNSGRQAQSLYEAAVRQARQPALYADLGVPDRIDARFDLYTLHVLVLVLRLREEGEEGQETAQALFDTYVSALDHTLRELGVGDISVGKKMRKLGEQLYGRMTAYETPLKADDRQALAAAFARNIFESEETEIGRPLADYALRARAALQLQPWRQLLAQPAWPEIVA